MPQRFRPRLTYANVVSTLCLFLLLGGGAYAATKLPVNSVGTRQLKKNAVTGAKVKDGSLSGADVDLQTLGTVPSATVAKSADTATSAKTADSAGTARTAGSAADAEALDGMSAAQLIAASKLRCPTGMSLGAGACIEDKIRTASTLSAALAVCSGAALRLPTMGELTAYERQNFVSPPPEEWVEPAYYDSGKYVGMAIAASKGGTGSAGAYDGFNASFAYRCATPASN